MGRWEESQQGSGDGAQEPTSVMGCRDLGWLTLPMALAQACRVSGPSVPSCCTFSPVRKSSRVKRNLQRMNQLEPAPRARPAHCTSRAQCSICPWFLWASKGARLGVPFRGARAGEPLGSAHTQGDEVPTLDVAQGLSAFLCLEEQQGSLQGAPGALEVCRTGGSAALGWVSHWLPP